MATTVTPSSEAGPEDDAARQGVLDDPRPGDPDGGDDGGGRFTLRPPTTRQLVTAVHLVVVIACCAFVFFHLEWRWVLTNTTPAGGDMGAHVWGPDYIKHHLFPQGRITGWTPDWYSGFPALHFYFPLPSVAIALLSYVLPYNIAFKLVVVSGVTMLPAAAAAMGSLLGMRRPYAACLAVGTIPFLFDQGFSIYGGNIASTLAGEFSFSISLSFALLFIGLLGRSLETGKGRGWAALAFGCCLMSHILPAILAVAAATVLTLLKPGIRRIGITATAGLTGAAIAGFWVLPFGWRLAYTNDMGWERITQYKLPLIGSFDTVTSQQLQAIGQTSLDPYFLRWLFLVALVGALWSVVLGRRLGTLLTYVAGLSALAFRFMPGPSAGDPYATGKLWNARMLPFWYLCLYLLAACAVAELALGTIGLMRALDRRMRPGFLDRRDDLAATARAMAGLASVAGWASADAVRNVSDDLGWDAIDLRDRAAARRALPQILVPVVAAFVVLGFVALPFNDSWLSSFVSTNGRTTFIDDWARWNFVGYEGKGEADGTGAKARRVEMFDLVDTMANVGRERGCGRSLWEYESELDSMGTPLALMLLPYWTKGCIGSSEGLYFESSPTTAAHFMAAGSVTLNPSNPERGLPYTPLDLSNVGIPRMQELGIRYYLALTPEAQAQAAEDARLTLVAESQPHQVSYSDGNKTRVWKVYEVEGGQLVEPLTEVPTVVTGLPNNEPTWKAMAARGWFYDVGRYKTPIATSGPPEWPRIAVPAAEEGDQDPTSRFERLGREVELPKVPITEVATPSNVIEGDDRLTFDVDKIGVPMLVKVSYFPAWKAHGAKGPYRVTPNMMVVIPTSNHVELRYQRTGVDYVGTTLSIGGLFLVYALNRRRASVAPLIRRIRKTA